MFFLKLGNSARVNGLRLRRDILGDQFLALGKDLAQRARIEGGARLFEGSPLHWKTRSNLIEQLFGARVGDLPTRETDEDATGRAAVTNPKSANPTILM